MDLPCTPPPPICLGTDIELACNTTHPRESVQDEHDRNEAKILMFFLFILMLNNIAGSLVILYLEDAEALRR